jgi:hypothetical protein
MGIVGSAPSAAQRAGSDRPHAHGGHAAIEHNPDLVG